MKVALVLIIFIFVQAEKVTRLENSPEVNSYRVMVINKNMETIRKHNSNVSRTFDMKVNVKFIGLTVK